MKKLILGVVVLLLVAIGVAGGAAFWFLHTPMSSSPDEVIVEIPHGESARAVAQLMADEGLVRNATAFRWYLRAEHAKVRSGEFRFRRDLTPPQVLDTILHGQVVLHKLTVAEGLTAREISQLVQDSGLGSGEEFLKLAMDPTFARSLGVPADSLEGFLFPDTYELEKNAGARAIATAMVKRFQTVWTPELATKAKLLGLDERQAVTLASIVEKETGAAEERPRIAGVFYNRLRKGMRLESDPTIIYGIMLRGNWDGNIHKADIHDASNLYDTYVIKGLPPGPIANPGAESLRAVADPEKHDLLFFVATGEGRHDFSATLKEHEAKVQRYQLHHGVPPPNPKKPT